MTYYIIDTGEPCRHTRVTWRKTFYWFLFACGVATAIALVLR